jgi:hypothetical protein
VWGAEHGVWLPQTVNLQAYAGHSVKLRLQTIAAYSYSNACFLFWGRPRVVVGPLDGSAHPSEVSDLTEAFRLHKDCRRYVLDPEKSGPLKTDQYDFTGGYFEYGQAGPWAEPALFGHPFCFGFQGWAGYEFDVTLPPRPTAPPAAVTATPAPSPTRPAPDLGSVIPVFTWDQQVYRGAPGGFAAFDPARMRLDVRMPSSDQGLGYAFAGFESTGCDTLWLQVTFDRYAPWPGYGEMDNNQFAGVVVDYHTPAGYSRRVWLYYAPTRPAHPELRCERRAPTWHMDLSRTRRAQEVNWEQVHADLPDGSPPPSSPAASTTGPLPPQLIGLDLHRWAPSDWDGRFWFGIGIQDVGDGRSLSVTALDRKADM